MQSADSGFVGILNGIFSDDATFRRLPDEVVPESACNSSSLREGFAKLFCSDEARAAINVVFIWELALLYPHSESSKKSSIVYIEKTKHSIHQRWVRYLGLLVKDFAAKQPQDLMDLRMLARQNLNFSFYSKIIKEFGPLRVWWADVPTLNRKRRDGLRELDARGWERLLLESYRNFYDCRPLKNRYG